MRHLLLSCIAVAALGFTACNNSTDNKTGTEATTNTEESTEARNIKVIKASLEGINQHNPDIVMKDASSGFTDYGDGTMEPMKNADSMKAMMKGWMASFPDFKLEHTEYFADGNKVVAISDITSTWKGDMMGMKATGKTYKFKDADIFTLNDKGQITEHRSVQNMGALMGMNMPEGKK